MNQWTNFVKHVEMDLLELNQVATTLSGHSLNLAKLKKANSFLQLFSRLDLNKNSDTSSSSSDNILLRHSIIIHDIDLILKDGDISNAVSLQDELKSYYSLREKIKTAGIEWLEQGLEQGNQMLLSKGIQIFDNLQILPTIIEDLLESYQAAVMGVCNPAFDLASINEEMKEKRKGGITTTPLVAFAGILWARTEKLADCIYQHTNKINILENYMSRRNDSTSQVFLIMHVKKKMKVLASPDEGLQVYFWRILSGNIDSALKSATQSANFLLQVLQAGYPKLLRIFSDLFARIKLTTGEEGLGADLIKKTLKPFETAYLTRSLTRLLETVTQIMQKAHPPNRDDAQKLSRTLSSELNAVKFNQDLLLLVAKNVTKALNAFRQKLDLLIAREAPFSITGTTPPSVQLQKIEAVNCIYSLSESVWGLLGDYDGTLIEEILITNTEALNDLMSSIATPMFTNVINELKFVMNKMHKDLGKVDPGRSGRASISSAPEMNSAYMTEFISKIRWVFRELISNFALESTAVEWANSFTDRIIILYLLNLSICPISVESRLRINGDLAYLETSLSQSLSLVHSTFESVPSAPILKGFKKLIFMDLGDIVTKLPIDPIFACNHVLKRSAIANPVQMYNWSELEYVDWMEWGEHDVKALITKCCDIYLRMLEEGGVKETCLEHPVLRKLLLEWKI